MMQTVSPLQWLANAAAPLASSETHPALSPASSSKSPSKIQSVSGGVGPAAGLAGSGAVRHGPDDRRLPWPGRHAARSTMPRGWPPAAPLDTEQSAIDRRQRYHYACMWNK